MTGNMIGRVFNNRYTITDRIGIGGMAEVYRAQDNTLGRIVAVKVMLPQYAADPNFTQRFKQEAAAAANLQSPYIVNVYDWGQDQGTYFIVMEYVRGSDLKTAIKERGAINQRKAAEIGSQVCQALSVAHNLDIIHRDIKPQNIMVQPDGNVKVMDFGIARAKNSVMTQTSSVLGTAHYISPEQAQGKNLTYASDIYSLGIVLYEAATGQLPFDGPDAVSVAMMQVNDAPIPPHEINPDIDAGLENIIMKALSKNPQDRFATANDMKMALNDYLAGRTSNFAVAPIAPIAMAEGTAVMPAVGGTTQNNGTTNYRADDSKKSADDARKKKIIIAVAVVAAIAIIAGIAFALTSGKGDPVPDVIGQTEAEATATLKSAGFEVGKVVEVYDTEIAAGRVVSTDPEAGARREKGTAINLSVSKGAEEVEVPDLTNMTADQAKQALSKLGLKAEAGNAEHSSEIETNHVMRQDPAAGTKKAKGSTVTYILSLGAETIDVPNVVGKSEANARTALSNAGLTVNVEYQSSSSVAEGVVISQNPSSGKLEKGKAVTITVSTGAEKVSVPDVTGQSESAARSALQNAGLSVTSSSDSSDTVPKGSVISQSPGGGSSVEAGSSVNIVISTGPSTPAP